MQVYLNRKKCTKCGLCAAICPEIFEINKRDHLAEVKVHEVPPINDLQEYCSYAAADCPTGAIKILKDKVGYWNQADDRLQSWDDEMVA